MSQQEKDQYSSQKDIERIDPEVFASQLILHYVSYWVERNGFDFYGLKEIERLGSEVLHTNASTEEEILTSHNNATIGLLVQHQFNPYAIANAARKTLKQFLQLETPEEKMKFIDEINSKNLLISEEEYVRRYQELAERSQNPQDN